MDVLGATYNWRVGPYGFCLVAHLNLIFFHRILYHGGPQWYSALLQYGARKEIEALNEGP